MRLVLFFLCVFVALIFIFQYCLCVQVTLRIPPHAPHHTDSLLTVLLFCTRTVPFSPPPPPESSFFQATLPDPPFRIVEGVWSPEKSIAPFTYL